MFSAAMNSFSLTTLRWFLVPLLPNPRFRLTHLGALQRLPAGIGRCPMVEGFRLAHLGALQRPPAGIGRCPYGGRIPTCTPDSLLDLPNGNRAPLRAGDKRSASGFGGLVEALFRVSKGLLEHADVYIPRVPVF